MQSFPNNARAHTTTASKRASQLFSLNNREFGLKTSSQERSHGSADIELLNPTDDEMKHIRKAMRIDKSFVLNSDDMPEEHSRALPRWYCLLRNMRTTPVCGSEMAWLPIVRGRTSAHDLSEQEYEGLQTMLQRHYRKVYAHEAEEKIEILASEPFETYTEWHSFGQHFTSIKREWASRASHVLVATEIRDEPGWQVQAWIQIFARDTYLRTFNVGGSVLAKRTSISAINSARNGTISRSCNSLHATTLHAKWRNGTMSICVFSRSTSCERKLLTTNGTLATSFHCVSST